MKFKESNSTTKKHNQEHDDSFIFTLEKVEEEICEKIEEHALKKELGRSKRMEVSSNQIDTNTFSTNNQNPITVTPSAENKRRSKSKTSADIKLRKGANKPDSSSDILFCGQQTGSLLTPLAAAKWRMKSQRNIDCVREKQKNEQEPESRREFNGSFLVPVAASKWHTKSKSDVMKRRASSSGTPCDHIPAMSRNVNQRETLLTPLVAAKWRMKTKTQTNKGCENNIQQSDRDSESHNEVKRSFLASIALVRWQKKTTSSTSNRRRSSSAENVQCNNLQVPSFRTRTDSCPAELSVKKGCMLAPFAAAKWRSKIKLTKNKRTSTELSIDEELSPEDQPKTEHSILNNGFSTDFESTLISLRSSLSH